MYCCTWYLWLLTRLSSYHLATFSLLSFCLMSPSACLPACLCACVPAFLLVCLSDCLSACVCPPACPSLYLSVSVRPFVCLSNCISVVCPLSLYLLSNVSAPSLVSLFTLLRHLSISKLALACLDVRLRWIILVGICILVNAVVKVKLVIISSKENFTDELTCYYLSGGGWDCSTCGRRPGEGAHA